MNQLVTNFQKNKFEEVRVYVKEFKGYDLLDIRVYTSTKDSPSDRVPTGKGLSLNVSHFGDLKNAILELETVLKENKFIE